ncbi:MAG: T9SS type A sorting domain-containing protein [Chlorobi bacterium]|nr:T9SS type A sorting domain-containing protein [Chlorobiota bacterium]
MRQTVALIVLSACFSSFAQNPNGRIDDLTELFTCRQYYFTMQSDGVHLATDVCVPIIRDDWKVYNITVSVQGTPVTIDSLRIARRGQQIFWMPDQLNPWQLPAVLTRTPYNKKGMLSQHLVITLSGYVSIAQDTRGRHASEGVYLAMYSDSWQKTPYVPPGWNHPLDRFGTANRHQDGYETLLFIRDSLRWSYNDTTLNTTDPILVNGNVCMFGSSALGNTQYQTVSVGTAGILSCLMPIVAGGEQWVLGHYNGLFRERLITGWLGGRYLRYSWDTINISNDKDTIHSLADYPAPYNQSPLHLWQKAVDFWSVDNQAHYPYSSVRALMDVSHATLPGNISRYTNFEVPTYNIVGWWDIYNVSQIETWLQMRKHTSHRPFHKLIVGPWAHQTIGEQKTGDIVYKRNSTTLLGEAWALPNATLPQMQNTELFQWFRTWLKTPEFVLLPDTSWQYVMDYNGSPVYVLIPADTYSVPYDTFINFLNGIGTLSNMPIRIKGVPTMDSNTIYFVNFGPTGTSVFGDTTGTRVISGTYVFHDSVTPPLRFYFASSDTLYGNWWIATDSFPPRNMTTYSLYLHPDGKIYDTPPIDSATLTYFIDPWKPVYTIGGPNMIVRTPDGSRNSQGPMWMNNPDWVHLTYPPDTIINGQSYPRHLAFLSEPLPDSLTTAGYTNIELWASGSPISSQMPDSLDMDIIVRIIDVRPDGKEFYVYEGAVNARGRLHAASVADGNPIDSLPWSNLYANKRYYFKFRSFPIAYTFGPGHRIKIVITGNNWPLYQSNPHVPLENGDFFRVTPSQMDTATYDFYGQPLFPRPILQNIHIAPDYQAKIELPVLHHPNIPGPVAVNTPEKNRDACQPLMLKNIHNAIWLQFKTKEGIKTIQVLDLQGKTIMYKHVNNQQITSIPLKLPQGPYILKITSNNCEFKTLVTIMQ